MNRIRLTTAICTLFASCLTFTLSAQDYDVVRVSAPNADEVTATALNDRGDVVGHAAYLRNGVVDTTAAWQWAPANGVQLLPAPPGMDKHYLARDVNNLGVIAVDGGGVDGMAWLYDGTQYLRVGSLGNDPVSELVALNDSGEGAGTSWMSFGRAFAFDGARLFELWPGQESQALAVNENGAVAGHLAFKRAFRWLPGERPEMLPAFGPEFPYAQALGLANDGTVVGTTFSGTGRVRAFLYTDQRGMELLPAVSGRDEAHGINGSGVVIGTSTDSQGTTTGWVWTSQGGVRLLDDAIGSVRFSVTDAVDLNAGGEILCHAIDQTSGDRVVVVLKPVTTSTVQFLRGDVNGDGGFDVADPVFALAALFGNGPLSGCADAADANDDGNLDVADAVQALNALFGTGVVLPAPAGQCGVDPTPDSLGCDVYSGCP